MSHHHPLDPTSHTVEMEQIAELNTRLAEPHAPTVTAANLGLTGAVLAGGGALSGHERVRTVSWRGAPDFPEIYAEFGAEGTPEPATEQQLHTPHLRELSRLLHLNHHWGL